MQDSADRRREPVPIGFRGRLLHRFAKLLLAAVTVGLFTNTGKHVQSAEQQRVPNIVLILADDVGVEPLGCYGGESYDTPRLDALARDGTRFNHCYSMYACHPTRVCLLTGRYPFRFDDAPWGGFPRSAQSETLAHVLKQAGYATAIAGKWQLALMKNDLEHPARLGFDQWCLFGWHEGPRYQP